MKKKIIIITICVLATAGAVFAYYMAGVASYQNKVKNTIITEVDTTKIPDGTYIGEYDVGFLYVKAAVTVKDGEMTHIELIEHHNDRGVVAEIIIDDMISEQRINVDGVTGATNSGTVIKKAVENALRNAG
ncbi:MAG: FMN-binding protein [Oscillospiraceae bacterium]|nr:FMN-binding protein [Oscillospiraceae bacterium]